MLLLVFKLKSEHNTKGQNCEPNEVAKVSNLKEIVGRWPFRFVIFQSLQLEFKVRSLDCGWVGFCSSLFLRWQMAEGFLLLEMKL